MRMSDESDAKQILTASPLENWRRPSVWRPPYYVDEDYTQQDLKSMNLSLNEALLTWLRIAHSGD